MTQHQILILATLLAAIALFLWGRLRHDVVAMAALLICAFTGLVPSNEVFSGFGHPAVITVICVLVLSGGLQRTGAVDLVARRLLPRSSPVAVTMLLLILLATVLSAFMNNVGALALLMPIGIQLAEREGLPPGKVLMPLSFGSILGGMTTLIGTPPNLIVAGFRAELSGQSFEMFDFSPVGVAVAVAGIIFIVLAGRFLVPARQRAGPADFHTGAYFTEARVPASSRAVGMTLSEVEAALAEAEAIVVGLFRGERRIAAPSPFREIHADDILLIQAEHDALARVLSVLDLSLEEAVHLAPPAIGVGESGREGQREQAPQGSSSDPDPAKPANPDALAARDYSLIELAVLPTSMLAGRSAKDIRLRTRFGINLLAVSRQGRKVISRLRSLQISSGDVLLMQGPEEAVARFAARYGCVPLASRALDLPSPDKAIPAMLIMAAAIAAAALGVVAPATAFAGAVLAFVILRIVAPRSLYESIDWPIVVLLGALIPVAGAMSSTGAADLIARVLLDGIAQGRPVLGIAVILIVSMTLSDFMNNAATAALMCPIAIGAAERAGASPDPFLMAVAVGASCAFLTPIGHQNNTLILGPGGFRFADYWRLGLPLEVIVVAVAVPLIVTVWPLAGG